VHGVVEERSHFVLCFELCGQIQQGNLLLARDLADRLVVGTDQIQEVADTVPGGEIWKYDVRRT
jgi:hypothetical protein